MTMITYMGRYPYEQEAPRREEDRRLIAAKPCPFCGSPNISLSRMGNYVHCNACGADGPEIQRGADELWRVAIEHWNLRSDRHL